MPPSNINRATARANSNIAFIKYWGNTDSTLRLPVNGSVSMNLEGLYAETTVEWQPTLTADVFELNGAEPQSAAYQRLTGYLDGIRARYGIEGFAIVKSRNNFPMGVGIASSAAAFAALATAATHAAGLTLSSRELSTLARLGSGSASRSIDAGFVEWYAGDSHETSFAESIAPVDHWDLVDVIAIVSAEHKKTGSTEGHQLADSSPLQGARIQDAQRRLEICRRAILERDFATFADVVELDSNIMHAVMMTSNPRLLYWQPSSVALMHAVPQWRLDGLQVCYTLDAGPNVHCLCLAKDVDTVRDLVQNITGVQDILVAPVGRGVVVE